MHLICVGNLCDPVVCKKVMQGGVRTILHFAANMGGMGTIHQDNDFEIFRQNNTITTNLLKAAIDAGLKIFLFAYPACVYPSHYQGHAKAELDVSLLKEEDLFDRDHISP